MTGRAGAETTAALGAVLDRLEAEAPEPVSRGRRALREALGWTGTTAWPEIAWTFSELADGLPFELVWRLGEPGLFWTAEPAAPEATRRQRLNRALELAERGPRRFTADDRELLARFVDAARSPWPIWLGGRHRGPADASKVYVSLGPGAFEMPADPAMRVLRALCGGGRPRLLGVEPDGAREFYWRRDERRPGDRYRLSRLSGLAEPVERVDAALRDWTGAGIDGPAPGRLGLSLRLRADGHPDAIAAFVRAAAVAEAATLRKRLLEAGGEANSAMGALWAEGRLQPMILTLAASAVGVRVALGLTLAAPRSGGGGRSRDRFGSRVAPTASVAIDALVEPRVDLAVGNGGLARA